MSTFVAVFASPLFWLLMAMCVYAHASFQLGASMLTLLNSHAIGAGKAHRKVLALSTTYSLGAIAATCGLLIAFVAILKPWLNLDGTRQWIAITVVLSLTGLLTVLTYYRRGKGTLLWLPRSFIEFASTRAKKTRNIFEAFSLGVSMVIAELPFIFAPMLVVACFLVGAESIELPLATLAYGFFVGSPLLFITAMIGSGHKISTLQRWRETNKRFLQWSGGLTLVLLAIYFGITFGDLRDLAL